MSGLRPLTEEHNTLLPHIERLRELADRVGELDNGELARGIAGAHDFLAGHLLPHAEAEEHVLYPAVGRAMGAAAATATMSRDHVEVVRLTGQLAALRDRAAYPPADQRTLRRLLYGLYTLISVHFAKEEEVYVPLLERALAPDEADRMLSALRHAAHG